MNLEDLDDNEIEHLMHIIWFALDYDATTHKMSDAERERLEKFISGSKPPEENTDDITE